MNCRTVYNVLRGEMSLVGASAVALYDALRISDKNRTRLNALPGMTGFWHGGGVQMRSHQRDFRNC